MKWFCLALRYLARGETFWSLESQFRIGKKTIFCIDACQAIFEILELRYVNMPRNTRKWLEISEKFYRRWEFLNGVSDTDGKHIVMEQLFNSGSYYRNYNGTDSIILLVMTWTNFCKLMLVLIVTTPREKFGVKLH